MQSDQVKYFDVIIAGAGPSGTSCALALRNAGLSVALIDKAGFPRSKACGDAIPVLALKVLDEIGTKYKEQFFNIENKKRINSTRYISSNGTDACIPWNAVAFNCPRTSFDLFLLECVLKDTGTIFFSETTIKGVEINSSNVVLQTDKGIFKCGIIIGCDGAQSILARKLNNYSINRNHCSAAVRAYYTGIKGIVEGRNEIFFSKKLLPGYFWLFPVNERESNVGFGMLSDTVSKKKIKLQHSLNEVIQEFPELAERFSEAQRIGDIEGFGLPLGTRTLPISGDRFLLCGDAASLIDPVSGAGIGNGMLSGKLAADHILQHHSDNLFTSDINKDYDKAVYARIGKSLRNNTRVLRFATLFPWMWDLAIFLLSPKNPLSFLFRKLL